VLADVRRVVPLVDLLLHLFAVEFLFFFNLILFNKYQ
jgi:hypothetical protein